MAQEKENSMPQMQVRVKENLGATLSSERKVVQGKGTIVAEVRLKKVPPEGVVTFKVTAELPSCGVVKVTDFKEEEQLSTVPKQTDWANPLMVI